MHHPRRASVISLVAALVVGLGVVMAASATATAAAAAPAPSAGAAESMPGGYHAVPTTRLLDTRNGTGAQAGVRAAGSTTSVTVTGTAGVPATGVSAVALTLVATGTTGNGYLTAFPHGSALPTASTLNWSAKRTVSNVALVKVGTDGKVDLRVSGTATHLVADVVGWVEAADAVRLPGAVTATSPVRVLDTRKGLGAPDAPVAGGRVLQLAVAGRGGVPASGAGAVVLNLTAVAGTSRGYVIASPTDPGSARTSTLNFEVAEPVANLVTVGLGPDGGIDLRVTVSGSVELVADVVGWVAAGPPSAPLGMAPVTPARLLDTRPVGPVGGGMRSVVRAAGVAGVPAGVGAAVLNVTVTDATFTGHLQVVPGGAGLPASSSVNFDKGRVKSALVLAPVSAKGIVDIAISTGGSVNLVVDVTGYVLGPPVDTTGPPAPTAVTANVVGSTVEVAWAPPSTSGPLTYRVERAVEQVGDSPRPLLVADRHPLTSITDTKATPGLPTHYVVRAIDAWSTAGAEASSPTVSIPLVIGEPVVAAPTNGGFRDVSCPTSSWCVALERDGGLRTWNGSAWSARTQVVPRRTDGDPYRGLASVSCADATFCVATLNDTTAVVVWRGGVWQSVAVPDIANAVSCPTTTRCLMQVGYSMVVTFDGSTVLGSTPLPSGVEWAGLSCASSTSCAVVGRSPDNASHAAVLRDGVWTTKKLTSGPSEAQDVSCPAVGSCVAVGSGAAYWVLTNGSWSTTRTSTALGDTGGFGPSIDCTSATWCLTDDASGHSARFDGSTWRAVTGGATGMQGTNPMVSCASTTFCVRVDHPGRVRYFRGSTWSAPSAVAPPSGSFRNLSCSSASSCVGADVDGAARQWNGTTWSGPLELGLSSDVECPADDWCLGAGTDSSGVTRYRVRSGTTWGPPVRASIALHYFSCPEKGWCMAYDSNLQSSSVYTNGAWSTPVRLPSADSRGYLLDCSSRARCVMTTHRAHRVWNGRSWSAPIANPIDEPRLMECAPDGWCLATQNSGRPWELTGRSTWSPASFSTGTQASLSCVSRTFCLAVSNNADDGIDYSAWGGVLRTVATVGDQPAAWGSLASCWAPGECFAVRGPRLIRVFVG